MAIEKLAERELIPSPGAGIGILGGAFYVHPARPEVMCLYGHIRRSDTKEIAWLRRSEDNGRTWGPDEEFSCRYDHPEGVGRRHPRGGYLDPRTGRLIFLWCDGVLPTDNPLEGMRRWRIFYKVSEDGGRSWRHERQLIHTGRGYDEEHHLPGVVYRRNAAQLGDFGQRPLTRDDGAILLPIQVSHAGPDGDYQNIGRGYTFTDCMLLIGVWRPDGDLDWTASDLIVADPTRTTRGWIEPTIAMLDGNRLLMVMRGSNDAVPDWPGYRWQTLSDDGGLTWQTPQPWTWDDGTTFFSPSSCSQLVSHSNGKIYWIGNIAPSNPRGNSPRYPLVMGEVDPGSGSLRRTTTVTVDDRRPGESHHLTLSNFLAREDRETGHVLIDLPRFFARDERTEGHTDFTAGLTELTIDVNT